MKRRNLILSTVSNLSGNALTPFLSSFRKFSRESDLVLFTHRLDTDTRALLSRFECVEFSYLSLRMRHPQCLLWPLWKRIFPRLNSERAKRRLASSVFNLFFLRNLLYLNYLDQLSETPDWVFLTDSRDVVFQDDLFARMKSLGLYCFLEHTGRTIASCQYNSYMVRSCGGDEALQKLGSCEISCAGTVLGDFENIRGYLQAMVTHAMTLKSMTMVPGTDQGLHNILVHEGLLPNLHLIGNGSGPVGTFGCVPYEEIHLSGSGEILQDDGSPYAVIHQHDRHPQIVGRHPVYQLDMP